MMGRDRIMDMKLDLGCTRFGCDASCFLISLSCIFLLKPDISPAAWIHQSCHHRRMRLGLSSCCHWTLSPAGVDANLEAREGISRAQGL